MSNEDFYVKKMMASVPSAWVLLLALQCHELRGYYIYDRGGGAALGLPYHRSWTPWSPWSECSRTCGGGIIMRTRLCRRRKVNRVVEKRDSCPGETIEYRICNTVDCPRDAVDFRHFQCALYNNRLVAERLIKQWVPYEKGENKCELKCQEMVTGKHYSFGKVSDGTECSNGPKRKDVCVNGRCLAVGCDGKVGSDAHLDVCGVCGGRNNTCVYYRNVYLGQPTEPGFQEIAIIPAGSTHLEIRDVSYRNTLALMDSSYQYVINGPGTFSYPGEYHITGTSVNYNRLTGNREIIKASGPTNQQLHVVALLLDRNPGIYYEYWAPKNKYHYITTSTRNPSRFNTLVNETPRKHGGGNFPYDKLVEMSQYHTKQRSSPVINRLNNPWYSHTDGTETNQLTYHRYELDNLQNRRWNDVNINIVEKSGNVTPLSNRYATDSPPSNKTACILCSSRRSSENRRKRINGTSGSCRTCRKVKNLPKNFCKSDFVVRGILIKKEKIQGKLRYVLQVIQSFKSNVPLQPLEYIWIRGKCACPKLHVRREYILMGYLDYSRRESRLLMDRKSYARRYKRKKSIQLMHMKRNGCANVT